MTTFSTFSDILPDPVNKISPAGSSDASGQAGPGFASVKFTSNKTTQVNRTISGRGVHREQDAHYWSFNINYNPMLRDDFDVIGAFLEGRNSRLKPFYVILPQYSKPKSAAFATWVASNPVGVQSATLSGVSSMMLYSGGVFGTNLPSFGDMFTITDTSDFNHQKVYKITAVETNSLYQAGTTQPSTTQIRIHFNPPLQRDTSAGSIINFLNPKFRVMLSSDIQEYDLNTDNLFSYSLSVEEIQP